MRHWQQLILDSQGYLESRLDAYELIKVVGQGTFGIVSLARHKNSQQLYAIKTVPIAKLNCFDASIEPRLMQRLSELGCPGIVKTYEAFQCAGQNCIVMEYMPEGSLMDFLTEQECFPLEGALVKRIVRQVASALKSLK